MDGLAMVGKGEGGKTVVKGPMAIFTDLLADKVGFTYNWVKPPEDSFGMKLCNGSWTGLIGTILRNEADLAIGPITPSYARFQVVDFSNLFDMQSGAILSGAPNEAGEGNVDEGDALANITWMNWMHWLPLLLCAFVVTVIFYIGIRQQCYFTNLGTVRTSQLKRETGFNNVVLRTTTYRQQLARRRQLKDKDFVYCFVVMFGLITASGPLVKAVQMACSQRLALGPLLLGNSVVKWFVMSSFQTDLVTGVGGSYVETRTQLVEEMREGKRISCTWFGSLFHSMLKNSQGDVHADLWKLMEKKQEETLITGEQMGSREFHAKVAAGTHTFMHYEFTVITLGNGVCKSYPNTALHVSFDRFFTNARAMAISRRVDSAFRKRFNNVIRHVYEAGIYNYWNAEVGEMDGTCFVDVASTSSQRDEVTVTMKVQSLQWLLVVTGAGWMASLLVLGFEISLHRIYFILSNRIVVRYHPSLSTLRGSNEGF